MTMDDLLPEDCFEELNNEVDKYCKFTKSSVVGPKGKSVQDRKRTSQTGNTLNYHKSPAALMFLDVAATALRLHPAQAEPCQIIKYDMGEQYEPHQDTFTEETLQSHAPESGQRIATALLYLNDVEDGGETDFPNMNITIEPKRNRCVFFATTHMGTETPLELSLHGALPVIRGQKKAINVWFRKGVYDQVMYQDYLNTIENAKNS
jgi:prolyl 4-hydroxylase